MGNSFVRALNLREQAKDLPDTEVSREEFIRQCEAYGFSRERAEQHAMFSEALGSAALIGGKMLKVKRDEP